MQEKKLNAVSSAEHGTCPGDRSLPVPSLQMQHMTLVSLCLADDIMHCLNAPVTSIRQTKTGANDGFFFS